MKTIKQIILALLIQVICNLSVFSQSLTQTIRGRVYDDVTQETLPSATIMVLTMEQPTGTSTNIDGQFVLENIPIGRHNLQVNMLGYQPFIVNELLITTGKETVLEIALTQVSTQIDEIVIKARSRKELPSNSMATLSARQFTIEEANRYAGGLDDPARLAASFAGVASSVANNGIVVRGNAPKGLLWRIEGVEIPNPNHFADYAAIGGGALTALSSQVLSNSDFYTGAFPSEYGNALSGVFDMKMRTGNTNQKEYTFQAGIIGLDFAAEGPFKEGSRSSYLFNYRYSTLGLISPILPEGSGIVKYQDLSFKFNFPTKKAGTFTFWGVGAIDNQSVNAEEDSSKWDFNYKKRKDDAELFMGATGLTYKNSLSKKTFLHSTLALSGNGFNLESEEYDNNMILQPKDAIDNTMWRYTLESFIKHRFSNKHTNKTGFYLNNLGYNIHSKKNKTTGGPLETYTRQKGNSYLLQFYTQSKLQLTEKFNINLGAHSQYFTLNGNQTIEPRAGIKYSLNNRNSLAFAYGLHSRLEPLNIYFVEKDNNNSISQPNKDLDFMKAHHFVLAYNRQLNENTRLIIEPYYQKLYDVPVVPGEYTSTINLNDNLFFNDSLSNNGTGTNIGIDLTLEQFLNKGFYYLLTASFFESKYVGGDGIERNTRFNKNYVINLLAGKEWTIGKGNNNIFSINARFSYLGGNRMEAVDEEASYIAQKVEYTSEGAFENKYPDMPILSFTISYKKNKPKYSSSWNLQIINALGTTEAESYAYNIKEKKVETLYDSIIVPNLSYKIQF